MGVSNLEKEVDGWDVPVLVDDRAKSELSE